MPVRLGPYFAATLDIAADPVNPGVLYAGTWNNGMFKSLDHGLTWFPINAGLSNPMIQTVIVDRQHPNIIYAGTYYLADVYSGVYKSTDGGSTWQATGHMINTYNGQPIDRPVVYTLAMDPSNDSILYAGTRMKGLDPNNPSILGGGGVFKTTNAGLTWQTANSNLPASDLYIYDLAVDPINPNRVYAAMHESGVYYSANKGASWADTGSNSNNPPNYSGRIILVDAADDNWLFFGTGKGVGVQRSTNMGIDWYVTGMSSLRIGSIAQNPFVIRTLYAAAPEKLNSSNNLNPGLYISTNRGESWQIANQGHSISQIAADPFDANLVYAGAINEGVLVSTDRGATWNMRTTGLSGFPMPGLAADPTNPSVLYAALSQWGVMKSQDGGATWALASTGLPGAANLDSLSMDPANPQVLYATTYDNGVYVTTNGGGSWSAIASGYPSAALQTSSLPSSLPQKPLPRLDQRDQDTSLTLSAATSVPSLTLAISPLNSANVLVGTAGKGILKLSGGSWTATSQTSATVYALFYASSGKAFAGVDSSSGGLLVSTNGTTWTSSNSGLTGRTVYALSQGPAPSSVLYAGTDSGLYRSVDNGASWVAAGLTGQVVSAVLAHPTTTGEVVAGTPTSTYISQNGGVNWTELDTSMRNYGVLALLSVPGDSNSIYLATHYAGIVKLRIN